MSSAAELRKEFRQKLNALQDSCGHEETEWMCYEWAVGHWNGTMVLICKRCEKELKWKKPETTGSLDASDDNQWQIYLGNTGGLSSTISKEG